MYGNEAIVCEHDGCGKRWEREPALEVACPVAACRAEPGQKCRHVSPSGHVKSLGFSHLQPWGHDAREAQAELSGAFGVCPLGRCGCANKPDLRARLEAIVAGVDLVTMPRETFAALVAPAAAPPAREPDQLALL